MKILRIWFKINIALLASLFVDLAILFTIPPTTTIGKVAQDGLSLLVFVVISVCLLRPRRKIGHKDEKKIFDCILPSSDISAY